MAASSSSQHRCVFGRNRHFSCFSSSIRLQVGLLECCCFSYVKFRDLWQSGTYRTMQRRISLNRYVKKLVLWCPSGNLDMLELTLNLQRKFYCLYRAVVDQDWHQVQVQIMLDMVPQPVTGSSNDPLLSAGLETLPKRVSTSSAIEDLTWHSRFSTQNLGVGLADQTSLTGKVSELSNYHSKLQILEDLNGAVTQIVNVHSGINNSSLQALGTGIVAGSQMVVGDAVQHSEKQMPQVLLSWMC
ncbi:hypothetical protein GW17_00014502 [Ensete ventricosum]|nr:hypothetical protein GW17_00014502 [Ensete ventricosum]